MIGRLVKETKQERLDEDKQKKERRDDRLFLSKIEEIEEKLDDIQSMLSKLKAKL